MEKTKAVRSKTKKTASSPEIKAPAKKTTSSKAPAKKPTAKTAATKKPATKKAPAKKAVKDKTTYEELLELAKIYQVDNNAMFIAASKQYDLQIKVINLIREALEGGKQDLIESKEYVKGSPNAYANPLIKELPKHSDSANRTLATMLDIITKLGQKKEEESGLAKFEKEFS